MQVREVGSLYSPDIHSSSLSGRTISTPKGLTFARAQQLRPGIALSAAQVAQLTSDMVWLETQTVTLPDGSTTTALAPRVYLAPKSGDLAANGQLLGGPNAAQGSLISAQDIQMALTGDLSNSATIAGRKLIDLRAQNIDNSGLMQGEVALLTAKRNISVVGGQVAASSKLDVNAGGDLNITSTTQSSSSQVGGNSFAQTGIDRVAGLYVSGPAGVLLASAGRDLNLTAAQISNQGTGPTELKAGGSVNMATVTESSSQNLNWSANNFLRQSNSQEVGSQISGGGAVTINAQKDVDLRAANVNAQGALDVQATKGSVNIEAGQSTQSLDEGRQVNSKGALSSTTTTTRSTSASTTAVGSDLGGQTVAITSGADTRIQGSSVIGDQGVSLSAGRNVTIEAAQNSQSNSDFTQTQKSGLMSGGGLSVSYGKQNQSLDQTGQSTTAAASTVGSLAGNVTITAGQTYTQTGSDIITPKGDIDITAQKVDITEARETGSQSTEQCFKQSGLTVAITSPAISALQTANSQIQAAGNTSSSRMQALAAANVGFNLQQGAAQVQDAISKGDATGGAGISISLGSSSSQSNSQSSADNARGSSVNAGGNITIQATGSGKDSDITIQGSNVTAGKATTLKADDQVNLLAASNTTTESNSNQSKSGSIGVAISSQGTGVTASASRATGQGAGNSTTFTNSQVAGSTVNIESGGDTTLQGAVVQGNQVTATVGGNLNIQSLQDTSQYKESSKSAGGSVTVGTGVSGNLNLAQTQINSDFKSVGEQSAIRAGDGGFDVSVNGKTDLIGGQITSTQAAVDAGKNTFSSAGGVTTTDLQNSASFEAKSASVGVGTGALPGQSVSAGMSGVGFGSDKGSASSATTAGISGVAGDQQARTGDQETGLTTIFDKDKAKSEVAAQVAITSEFGKHAPKLVADYTETRRESIKLQALQAERSGDPQSASRLRDEAARWDEGGAYHVGLQTITGALSGGAGGALGAAGVAAAAPLIESITAKLPLPEPLQAVAGMVIASAIGASAGGSAGAAMGFNVDTNNRSLHSSERKTAIALAKASDGRYSEEEIVAQLRQMPNMLLASAGDKDAATGAPEIYANMQDPATQARWEQERKDDPNMQVNVSGVSMMERQNPANGELQAFIVNATTFPSGPLAGRSPYVLTPAAASQILNQAAAEQRANAPAQPRHHNCASTECLLMGANYNPNNPQNRAEMERRESALKAAGVIITGPALLAAAATPAGQAALQTLLWNKAAATGATAGAGANAAVQYATTGKVDPVGMVVGAATGALGGGALNTLTTAKNVGPLVAQAGGLTAAVGINAAGAAVTNGEQGATAGATIVAYPFGQIPLVGPLLGAFAQEALTIIFSTNSSTATKTNPTRGGQ